MGKANWAAMTVLAALAVPLLAAGGSDVPAAGAGATWFEGFTRPSLEVTVASRAEGLVGEVLVEEGRAVKKGEPMLRLDSTVEKLEVELSRLQAEGERQLEAAVLIEKQKANEVERARTLLPKGGITGTEVEEKELNWKVAQLNVELAKVKQQQAKVEYDRDKAKLAEREIRAPADGVVTRLFKVPGEAVQRLERVAALVQVDPLDIVLNVAVETRGRFAAGQKAAVVVSGETAAHEATITEVDPVVDFASNSYRVKVRLANPGGKLQAGLGVKVELGVK